MGRGHKGGGCCACAKELRGIGACRGAEMGFPMGIITSGLWKGGRGDDDGALGGAPPTTTPSPQCSVRVDDEA